jgi:hypothetical protein
MKALLGLVLLGCAGVQPTLTEEIEDAKAAWSVLDMCPVVLRVRSQAATAEHCSGHKVPEGNRIEGCSKISECKIYISDDLDQERRRIVVLHELGHLIKGTHGHLACTDQPGDDIMCPAGGMPGTFPTARDRAFVEKQ